MTLTFFLILKDWSLKFSQITKTIFALQEKLDGVALLITNLPPFSSTTKKKVIKGTNTYLTTGT